MTGMIMGTVIGAFLALLGTALAVGVGAANKKQELDVSQKLNSENIAFTQQENDINRAREDNYLQRRVADATAAGLSPLSVADNQPAAATVSVPQNTFMPNLGQYGIGMADAIQKGFSEAGSKAFESSENDKRIQSAERQLADTLANSNDISERQEATKRFVAQLGADTQTANTIAEIVSKEKMNGYDNATKVAQGLPWLLTEQGQTVTNYDSKTGRAEISYATRDRYIKDFKGLMGRSARKHGYSEAYFIQARAYCEDGTVNLADRVTFLLSFQKGEHPSIPKMYTFKD